MPGCSEKANCTNGLVLCQQCSLMHQTTYIFKWCMSYHLKWPQNGVSPILMNWVPQLQSICSLIIDSCSSGSKLVGLINIKQWISWLHCFISSSIIKFSTVIWISHRESYSLPGWVFCGLMYLVKRPMVQAISYIWLLL